jgi:SAM-dependent methyltransferase
MRHDGEVTAYAKFAGFYDQIMGDRSPDTDRIRRYISSYLPTAGSLLELGCGTGALLAELAGDMPVAGVDRSPEMLRAAAASVPGAKLVQAEMTSFSLGATFDVVICIFDTLNHLQSFESWRELFNRAHEHLADGGLFIFDVNTTGRYRRLWHDSYFGHDFGQNTVIMDVNPGGGELSIWEVKIFEHLGGDLYQLHHEIIPELGVPLEVIREALDDRFELLLMEDIDGRPVSDEAERVYFTYRRRPAGLGAG